MKIGLLSDLHLEGGRRPLPEGHKVDVLILAGDIITTRKQPHYDEFQEWACSVTKEVLYVYGNHEFYHSDLETTKKELKKIFPKFHHLDNESFLYEGKKFYGSTLWADCLGKNPMSELETGAVLNDFRVIKGFTTRKMIELFEEAVSKLEQADVIITHHMPSLQCVNEKFKGSLANGGFASDLDYLIYELDPMYWVHGHGHDHVDLEIYNTRVLSNPWGYRNEYCSAKPGTIEFFEL